MIETAGFVCSFAAYPNALANGSPPSARPTCPTRMPSPPASTWTNKPCTRVPDESHSDKCGSPPDSTVPTEDTGFGRCDTSPQYMLVLSRWRGGGSWGGPWGAVVASVTRFTAEAVEVAVHGYVHPRLGLAVLTPAVRFAAAAGS